MTVTAPACDHADVILALIRDESARRCPDDLHQDGFRRARRRGQRSLKRFDQRLDRRKRRMVFAAQADGRRDSLTHRIIELRRSNHLVNDRKHGVPIALLRTNAVLGRVRGGLRLPLAERNQFEDIDQHRRPVRRPSAGALCCSA